MTAVGWFWIAYGLVGLIVARVELAREYRRTGWLDMPVVAMVTITITWPLWVAVGILWLLAHLVAPADYWRRR
jgi:hypothetical protein